MFTLNQLPQCALFGTLPNSFTKMVKPSHANVDGGGSTPRHFISLSPSRRAVSWKDDWFRCKLDKGGIWNPPIPHQAVSLHVRCPLRVVTGSCNGSWDTIPQISADCAHEKSVKKAANRQQCFLSTRRIMKDPSKDTQCWHVSRAMNSKQPRNLPKHLRFYPRCAVAFCIKLCRLQPVPAVKSGIHSGKVSRHIGEALRW